MIPYIAYAHRQDLSKEDYMNDSRLAWTPLSRKTVFSTRVFDVDEITSRSPEGEERLFLSLEASDWVIVVPVLRDEAKGDSFVMVRQWRHGAGEMSLEFPGGVMNPGEAPDDAARRELLEETGYAAGSLEHACSLSPNPAIMGNRCHIFVAGGLSDTGAPAPDDDEYIGVETVPADEAIEQMGRPPYIHALMQSALFAYLQKKGPSAR